MTFTKFLKLANWLFMPKKLYISNPFNPPDAPEAPNFSYLAEQTANNDWEAIDQSLGANRPTQINPYGTSTWTQGDDIFDQTGYDEQLAAYNKAADTGAWGKYKKRYNPTGQMPNEADFTSASTDWTQTTTFSPEQKRIFDLNNQTNTRMGELGLQGLNNTGDLFSNPYKTGLDPLQSYESQRGDLISNMMARTNEDVSEDRDARASQLVAQGIPRGSDAFDKEM